MIWNHKWRPVTFLLVVHAFGVKYVRKQHVEHLINFIINNNAVSVNWTGSLYWLVPAQDAQFFYICSHLSALQNCAFFSTKYQLSLSFKNELHNLVIELCSDKIGPYYVRRKDTKDTVGWCIFLIPKVKADSCQHDSEWWRVMGTCTYFYDWWWSDQHWKCFWSW